VSEEGDDRRQGMLIQKSREPVHYGQVAAGDRAVGSARRRRMPKKIAIAPPRAGGPGRTRRTIARRAGNMIAAPAPWMMRKTISQALAAETVVGRVWRRSREEAVAKMIVRGPPLCGGRRCRRAGRAPSEGESAESASR